MRQLLAAVLLAVAPAASAAGIDPALMATAKRAGVVDALIVPAPAAPIDAATLQLQRGKRLHAVHAALRSRAISAQRGIVAYLAAQDVAFRPYSIANVVRARLTPVQLRVLASRADVVAIVADVAFRADLPKPEPGPQPKAASFNLSVVGATTLWADGITGQGIVVAGQDTGYQWDHPALRASYRGWSGTAASHAYAWHDAIHAQVNPTASGNPCGYDAPAPCDDDGHGTHTMGIMVGDDGAGNQVGMAPGARWIGCRNMDRGWGSPATYLECLEWFLAPTDANDMNPNPAMAPHVINNSWGCPGSEGCDAIQSALLEEATGNLRLAGILFVAAAGNAGPACGTIREPPSYFAATLSIGAAGDNSGIASFSSRGPTPAGLLKPDLTAPGISIRSTLPTSTYGNVSGTSMASPHVAGAAALIMAAAPHTIGRPALLERVLRAGASPRTQAGSDCGDFSGSAVPNAVHGHGFLDTVASVVHAQGAIHDDGFE